MLRNSTDPKPSSPQDFSLEGFYKTLEAIPKAGAIIIALFYATGLVVISGQYAKYKIQITTLVQSHYIAAGFSAMLPMICGAISFIILLRRKNSIKRSESQRTDAPETKISFKNFINSPLLKWILRGFGFLILILLGIYKMKTGQWINSPLMSLLVFLFGILSMEMLVASLMRKAWISSILASYTFLFYLFMYGYFVYETIDQTLGGGRPEIVQLISDSNAETKRALLGAGIVYHNLETSLTEPIFLITTTDKDYLLFHPRTQNVISLNKDMVRIVLTNMKW